MNHAVLATYCLVANLAVIGAVLGLLRIGLQRANLSGAAQARTLTASALVLFGWYALISVLGLQGMFALSVGKVPLLRFGIVVPIAAVLHGVCLWRLGRTEESHALFSRSKLVAANPS